MPSKQRTAIKYAVAVHVGRGQHIAEYARRTNCNYLDDSLCCVVTALSEQDAKQVFTQKFKDAGLVFNFLWKSLVVAPAEQPGIRYLPSGVSK